MKPILFILVAVVSCFGQTYPRWFLDPGDLRCGPVAAGFSVPYFHASSSDSVAFADACANLSRLHYTKITGGEAFWTTEAGMYWMGNNFVEEVDSAYLRDAISHAEKLDSCTTDQMTILLIAQSGCDIPDSARALTDCPETQPGWVEDIPQTGGFIYAEGVAPQYFYESSSWETAEKRAIFNLARSVKLSMEALQKMNGVSGQEIRNEEISVTLRDVQVVHRWLDSADELYYVLVKMPAVPSGGEDSTAPK